MFRDYFTKLQSPARNGAVMERASGSSAVPRSTLPPFEWYVNKPINGECIDTLGKFPDESINCIITDPPYLVNYQSRDGRSYQNDNPNDGAWLLPAFKQMYRVLNPHTFCISFVGFTRAEWFLWAWREAGFRIEEHIVFIKHYPSSTGKVARHHEQAYVLSKGRPQVNAKIPSVIEFPYSGNKYHPSQKPLEALIPLVNAFSYPDGIVLDPFAGSFSTFIAARQQGRRAIGVELDEKYYKIAVQRLHEYKPNNQPYVRAYS